jgi:serine/threonine-protein kinase
MQAQAVGQSEESLNFFRQEAEALARLNHPSIAQVYDASVSGNDLYIAMEYIEGESLRDKLRREGALPLGEAVRILREACIGLDTAHRLGIIHRDMKPENLMLVREELGCIKVKILDFGLAILDNKDAMENITGAVMITGTPSYMSPEQIRGLTVTPATDVYSLGVIGYEMLTGKNPFEGKEMTQVMYNHVYVSPPSIRSVVPKVPQELEEVLMRALEKDPQNRYATAGEFAHAL